MLFGTKKILHVVLFLLTAIYFRQTVYCQSGSFFIKHGNNLSDVNCGGILFAPITNKNHQAWGAGSVLLSKQINLTQAFSTSFILDYTDTTAVDGGAFILQSDSSSVGETFHGLGYKGINQSVAITFDVFQNSQHHDPSFDHVSIQSNGDVDHNSANNLAGPVSIESLYKNVLSVKSFHHLVTVSWDPATKILATSVDGSLLISSQTDLVQNIFRNNPVVYWGFTASNTQPTWFPADSELTFGYMHFFYGDIYPKYTTLPVLDTCFGTPVQFFDNSVYTSDNTFSNLPFAKWFWSFGDGTESSLRNPPPHSYPSAGSYTLKFTVTNQLGCTIDTLVKKITLGSKPVIDFAVSPTCTNSNVIFSDLTSVAVGIPVIWSWDLGNGVINAEQNPVTSYASTGQKNISVSVRTNFGCESDTTRIITVDEKPLIDFSFTKDCEGNVQYQSSLQNNVSIQKWFWDFGDSHISSAADPSHFFTANNNYSTSFWATSSACNSDTIKKIIPINKVYASGGNDIISVKGQPVQLHGAGGTSYSWSPSTGLNNPLISDPIAVLFRDQTYILNVQNMDGCEGSDTVHIKVFNEPDIFVANAFTPNNDGRNDILQAIAPGIKQFLLFRIYNRWGNRVFESNDPTRGWNGKSNNHEAPGGVYVWLVQGIDYKGNRIEKKGTVLLIH